MPIAKLTIEKNPKLVIVTNNRLEYEKEDKSIGRMKESTALINVIKEAGNLASMKHGTVLLSVEKDGNYKNYFVHKLENKTIVLNSTDASDNKDATVYVNYVAKEGARPYYVLNTQSVGGKELTESLGVKDDKYLSTRVTLVNDDIKQQLKGKSETHQAIISKDGFSIEEKHEVEKINPPAEVEKENILHKIDVEHGNMVDHGQEIGWFSDPQGGNDLERAISAYDDLENTEKAFVDAVNVAQKADIKIDTHYQEAFNIINTGESTHDRLSHVETMQKEIIRQKVDHAWNEKLSTLEKSGNSDEIMSFHNNEDLWKDSKYEQLENEQKVTELSKLPLAEIEALIHGQQIMMTQGGGLSGQRDPEWEQELKNLEAAEKNILNSQKFVIREAKIIPVVGKDVKSHETIFESQAQAEKYQYLAGNGHTLPKKTLEKIEKETKIEKSTTAKKPPFKRKTPSVGKDSQSMSR